MPLDNPTLTDILARETSTVFMQLLTLTHVSWASPIYLARSNTDFVSNGHTFAMFPFEAILPTQVQGQVPQGKITLGAGNPVIIAALRSIVAPPILVTVQVVRAQVPDTPFYSFSNLYLRKIVGDEDSGTITGVLTYDNTLKQPYTATRITPLNNPGVFG